MAETLQVSLNPIKQTFTMAETLQASLIKHGQVDEQSIIFRV